MKEPKRIPLTDNPRTKEVKKIPLTPILDHIENLSNENHSQNCSQSIQQLESDKTN